LNTCLIYPEIREQKLLSLNFRICFTIVCDYSLCKCFNGLYRRLQ